MTIFPTDLRGFQNCSRSTSSVGSDSTLVSNRFPPPWSVREQNGCFVVRDNKGQALSNVYFEDGHDRRSVTTVFTRDEARHIAAAVAKLPELL
jgi:hypothetical protein